MIRLFSSFDKSLALFPSLPLFLFLIILTPFYLKVNRASLLVDSFTNFLSEFFLSIKPLSFSKVTLLSLNSFMLLIFSLNFTSIMPYNFTETRQISSVLFYSLVLWVRLMSFYLFYNLKGFLSHCIPEGTPIYLTWFLFLVELIRNSIRPITLTVRLVANILAGHLLIILLSKLVFCFTIVLPLYAGLNMVELFVSLIQSYIFVTIIRLYYRELS